MLERSANILGHFTAALDKHVVVEMTDLSGNITFVNDLFCQVSGYSRDELIGKNHRIISSGIHSREFFEGLWKTIRAGNTWRGEICNRSKDGAFFWLQTTIVPFRDDTGAISSFLALRSDITSQKNMENALLESEEWNRLIVETASDGIVMVDSRGFMSFANRAFEQMLGYSAQELIGHDVSLIFPERLQIQPGEGFKRFTDSRSVMKSPHRTEVVLKRRDGTEVPVELSVGKIHRGSEWAFTGIFHDISERRMTEDLLQKKVAERTAELEQINEALQTEIAANFRAGETIQHQQAQLVEKGKMAALGQMAGGVAHEINTPLCTISLTCEQLLEMLNRGKFDPEHALVIANRIHGTTAKIARIVAGLRSFARDSSKDPFNPTAIAPLVEDTLSFCREKLINRGITLEFDLFPAPGKSADEITAECRPSQISQVLVNLISNAEDAIIDLPEKWIRVGVCDLGEKVEITVTDSGTGIPKHVQERLFDPFFTTKDVGSGTGLGLSISKGLIDAHRGTLTLDSASPNTRFVITLNKEIPAK